MEATRDHTAQYSSDEELIDGQPEEVEVMVIPDCEGIPRPMWITQVVDLHSSCGVVTMEGIDVCLSAWRHIAGVSESTFHRFQGYAAKGEST